jgi:hypothetical protein
MTQLVVHGEELKETPENKRKRLATELRLIQQQYNSKLTELLDLSGITVVTRLSTGESFEDDEGVIIHLDISHQTPVKRY